MDNIKIGKFSSEYLYDCVDIVSSIWRDEIDASEESKKVIYKLLVDQYFVNENYSYMAIEDSKIVGFLFAGFKTDKPYSFEFEEEINELNDTDKNSVINYFKYVNYNANKLNDCIKENDVVINLFVSISKGMGTKLKRYFEKELQYQNVGYYHLWTDSTCNVGYYKKNNFTKIDEFQGLLPCKDGYATTYIYKYSL